MKKSLHAYKKDFLYHLEKFRGYSDLTLKSYDETLCEAFRFIEAQSSVIDLMPYRIYIAHLNAKTISKKLSAIRSFVLFLNDQGESLSLKADDSIKVPKTLPKPISDAHIKEALDAAPFQERLIVVMLYTLGLRISELATLKIDAISPQWVRVVGKGQKSRDVPMLEVTYKMIQEHLKEANAHTYLFENEEGHLSENSLRYLITKCFKRVGLKVTPHQLRHAYATELLNADARIADVSELLGHASMSTTQLYTKLGSALKMQNYLSAHPLCQDHEDG